MRMLRTLLRVRLMRGVLQGSPLWVTVGAVVVARRLIRWVGGRSSEVVFRGEVRPGESLTISHLHQRHEDDAGTL